MFLQTQLIRPSLTSWRSLEPHVLALMCSSQAHQNPHNVWGTFCVLCEMHNRLAGQSWVLCVCELRRAGWSWLLDR